MFVSNHTFNPRVQEGKLSSKVAQSITTHDVGFPGGSDDKESARSARDLSLIPGSGRSPGDGNGNPLPHLNAAHDSFPFILKSDSVQLLRAQEKVPDI